MLSIQAAIQHAIEHGDLRYAGWLMLVIGLGLVVVGVVRNQSFKVGYWRMAISLLVLGITAMSGLLAEGLKIIAKLIGAN